LPSLATWHFVGAFILFGVFMLLAEDTGWRPLWVGLCTLSLGGFAFSMVRDALVGGEMRLQNVSLRRADHPWRFWAAVAVVAVAGTATCVGGLWFLLTRS
jgi:hypothetical protein